MNARSIWTERGARCGRDSDAEVRPRRAVRDVVKRPHFFFGFQFGQFLRWPENWFRRFDLMPVRFESFHLFTIIFLSAIKMKEINQKALKKKSEKTNHKKHKVCSLCSFEMCIKR